MKTKETKSRLIRELVKDARRSDREIAKTVGASQPTISRLVKKKNREGRAN